MDFGEGERFEVEFDARAPAAGEFPRDASAGRWGADLARNGILATAMHCVNAIPYVVEAEPGIRTYLDLPLIAGRAGHELTSGSGATGGKMVNAGDFHSPVDLEDLAGHPG